MMPEFILNAPQRFHACPGERSGPPAHPYYALDEFAKGYVEAMFFTNGDTGDSERENYLNELGTDRLTRAAVASIAAYCAEFQNNAAALLKQAYTLDYTPEQAGRDLWFTAQGHGVGFWDRDVLDVPADAVPDAGLDRALSVVAKHSGETTVETWRGWIHHR